MTSIAQATLEFELPAALAAHEPPEARGLARDGVRLMVSHVEDDSIVHAHFHQLPNFLKAGDVLVVNTSATINAALAGMRQGLSGESEPVLLHLSMPLSNDRWIIELRRSAASGSVPLLDAESGEVIRLPAGAKATLIGGYRDSRRLWIAHLAVQGSVLAHAEAFGSPIRYGYVERAWPLSYYQTIFAREPGSAEMPSAGRAFTVDIAQQLERMGVHIVPITLHSGVASLDGDETPYPERYRVPRATAEAVNRARSAGGRIIAVGTTVVRALETVASDDGRVRSGCGWTDLVISPERGVHTVDALLTGLHAPRASHLWMLEAIASRAHLASAYEAALRNRYLWHEFGDMHLIVGFTTRRSRAVHNDAA
jgi:S-adenosylmethionine:tRNA ribosyltransferase-isomerase